MKYAFNYFSAQAHFAQQSYAAAKRSRRRCGWSQAHFAQQGCAVAKRSSTASDGCKNFPSHSGTLLNP
jgi:hypothetical protein